AAGGGTVLLPPGEYTSGTLHLRSHVRLEIAAGATLFASTNVATYDFGKIPSKAALLFGEDLEDVTIEGGGTVDGQAEHEWRFDGLYLYTSLKEAVWADGIDMDGCKNISITNCNIETGDDCIIFISVEAWGPALPCENITVSHCRLSSASAGVKFSEGNKAGV